MELLFHPWFTFLQEISGFSIKKLHEKSIYVTALNCVNPDQQLVCVGDTEGTLYQLKPKGVNGKSFKNI